MQDLVDLAIEDLEAQGTNPQGWDTLKTGEDEYRLWLNYRYRMRYCQIEDRELEIEIFYVGNLRDALDEPSPQTPS
ncbi:hypothetical protein FKG94_11290 [Exilibacterium tricleocarpae]|uniref:Type II toxin-antitoxin system RelE/ParE family toxin n=1 Tax=Exilibacterium tricleocarpae TaxID=2591008 RepID=A0A545TQE5_9GAMM|nr:hypothetical protein [Exilibacterium tricleocarpae]TQV79446.1 hypothetical protein FKG94_11290 [Exilibacterium tricleocarpae]